MSDVFSFIQKNGAGVGILTMYTGAILYYFVISHSSVAFGNLFILGAVAPAIIVYEITEEFTNLIIKQLLEHQVAITRLKLDLQNEGEFEDWYSGENADIIDELDQNTRQELTTAICALLIGFSAPLAGHYSVGKWGFIIGLFVTLLGILVALYALRQIVQTIKRTSKVINT